MYLQVLLSSLIEAANHITHCSKNPQFNNSRAITQKQLLSVLLMSFAPSDEV